MSDCTLGSTPFFCQQSSIVWQADWFNASGRAARQAEVLWGDNLTHHTWNTHAAIRVEVALTDLTTSPLLGYTMALISGTGATEMQGTDGTTALMAPTVYSETAKLTIQKLDDSTRVPIYTLLDRGVWERADGPGGFAAEVTVSGRIVYGYNLMIRNVTVPDLEIHKHGWWRLTFSLDASSGVSPNVRMVQLPAGVDGETLTYTPTLNPSGLVTSIDVYVEKASTGGGGGTHTP